MVLKDKIESLEKKEFVNNLEVKYIQNFKEKQ